jgi:hypothetical protein
MVPWLVALAQIILFFRNVEIFKKYFFQREYFVILWNSLLFEIEISKLINYSTNMCKSHQGTTIIVFVLYCAISFPLMFE